MSELSKSHLKQILSSVVCAASGPDWKLGGSVGVLVLPPQAQEVWTRTGPELAG